LIAERLESRDEIAELIRAAEPWAIANPSGIQMEPWWLLSYLETMARKPVAVIIRDGNDPIAFGFFEKKGASLALRGLIKKRVLVFLSQGPSDFSDILIAPGAEPNEALPPIAKALRDIPKIDEIRLEQFPESSPLAQGLAAAVGTRLQDWVKVYFADLSVGYEALWRGAGRNARRDIHKKTRRFLERFEIRHEVLREAEEALLSEIISLNQKRGDRKSPFLGKRAGFTLRMIRECQAKGRLLLFTMRANGSLVSYRLGFLRDGVFYDWNTSYDPALFELSPGKIQLAWVLRWCAENQLREFNFMRGDEEYKRIWSTGHTTNRALIQTLPTLRLRLASAWARRRAQR